MVNIINKIMMEMNNNNIMMKMVNNNIMDKKERKVMKVPFIKMIMYNKLLIKMMMLNMKM
jgi:hypothetical protein